MTVSTILYRAAGSPAFPSTATGICALCGVEGDGVPFHDWVRDTFMDYDKLKPGTIVCVACQFCCTDHSEVLQRKLGRDKPQRMRNYSHFVWPDGRWEAYHKGQKAEMFLALYDPDCSVAVVSMSGQKHVLFRAKPGWWQIEEHSALPFRGPLAVLMGRIRPMLSVFSKAEIESGHYAQHRITAFGVEQWWAQESEIRRYRGAMALKLAVWLSQKEGDNDDGSAA